MISIHALIFHDDDISKIGTQLSIDEHGCNVAMLQLVNCNVMAGPITSVALDLNINTMTIS